MKSKIIWIVAALLFVALIAGAGALYDKLFEGNGPGELIIEMPTGEDTGKGSQQDTVNDSLSPEATDAASDMPATAPQDSNSPSTEAPDEEPTNPAPDFTMIDINGKELKLSDLRGKPVVLNFWASWCGYCVEEMPDFEEYYKIYGDDINFVMLNTLSGGETISSGKNFISKSKYSFPVYFDEDGLATYYYIGAGGGIPQTYFIDAKGNLVARWGGMITPDLLKQGIDLINS